MDRELPKYECIAPTYLDDILWPEGATIETDMTPNMALKPLNGAAENRMNGWLKSLPGGGQARQDDIVQAAMEMRPKIGDSEIALPEFAAAVVQRALEIRAQREGRPVERLEVNIPGDNRQAPVMPNLANRSTSDQRPRRVKGTEAPPDQRVKPQPPIMGTVQQRAGHNLPSK